MDLGSGATGPPALAPGMLFAGGPIPRQSHASHADGVAVFIGLVDSFAPEGSRGLEGFTGSKSCNWSGCDSDQGLGLE